MTSFTAWLPRGEGHGHVPDAIEVRPTWFKVTDRGGSYRAEFRVEGAEQALWSVLEWMGRKIHVLDEYGTNVWRGKITEIDLKIAGMNVALSYQSMFNRVKVLYAFTAPDGTPQALETTWEDNALSQSEHGVRELLHTMSDTFQTEAEGKRDRLLDQFATPKGVPSMAQVGTGATIAAQGFFHFNDWKYVERKVGRYEWPYPPTREIMVGYQYTGDGFNWFFNRMHDLDAGIKNIRKDNWINITGTDFNNKIIEVTSEPSGDSVVTFVSSQIHLEPQDDIRLNAAAPVGFITAGFREEEVITISGSVSNPNGNNGAWPVENITNEYYMDTSGSRTFENEDEGPTLTLTQGISVELGGGLGIADELENTRDDTVTITALGYGIAQQFTAPGTWDAQLIALTCYRVGEPSDNFIIRMYGDNAGALDAGDLLGTLTVTGMDLSLVSEQRWFEFPTPIPLTSGEAYWIHVSRTGALDPDDFYMVGVTEDNLTNKFQLADTGAWYDYGLALPFLLYATEDTKDQIAWVMDRTDQFGGTVIWNIAESTVRTNQYLDGRSRGQTVIEHLMDLGGPNGRRLILLDDEEGNYHISEEPAKGAHARYPLIWADGRVTRHTGGPIPRGQIPVGEWVEVAELPGSFSELAGELSPLYVMEGELDIEQGGTPVLRPRQVDLTDRIERA